MSDVSHKNLFYILVAFLTLQGCGKAVSVTETAVEEPPVAAGPDSGEDSNTNPMISNPGTNNRPPTLSGTAPAVAVTNQEYLYSPKSHDADGDRLAYRGQNIPRWLTLDSETGELWGTPEPRDIGGYRDITISVSDRHATFTIEPFEIEVSAVSNRQITLEWKAPASRTDGSALVNLKGFRILRGRRKSRLHEIADLNNPGIDRLVIENLGHGEWWFALTAYDSAGIESDQSKRISFFID